MKPEAFEEAVGMLYEAFEKTLAKQDIEPDQDPGQTIRAQPMSLPDANADTEEGGAEALVSVGAKLGALPEIGLEGAGDLELLERLGHGGMGEVYRATQRSLGREVALKMLHKEGRQHLPSIEGLLREASLCGGLEHPNIIPIYALGRDDERGPLLMMKRVEGVVWRALIKDPKHPVWEGGEGERLDMHLDIMASVCNAVHFAHSKGVVHRDIKPENVMLGAYGEVYLLDWGIALDLGASNESPGENLLLGSPGYMAPEMTRSGHLPITPRTDVYLLGATLHEILTGQLRHTGDNLFQVLHQAYHSEPFDYGPEVPVELAALCNRACARDPMARLPDAAAFREALEAFQRHKGAVEIENAAHKRLDQLRALTRGDGTPQTAAIDRLFSECRFGFQEALEVWPDNATAREGLQSLLELMIEVELRAGNPHAAQRLMAELPDPRPGLGDKIDEALRETEAAARASSTLDLFRREHRLPGLDWGRSAVAAGNGVLWMGLLLTASVLIRTGIVPPTPERNFLFGLAWLLIATSARYLFRDALAENRILKHTLYVVALVPVLALINRAFTLTMDRTFLDTIMGDFLILTACLGCSAVYADRAIWIPTAITALGGILASFYPDHALDIAGVVALLISTFIAWLLRPHRNTLDPVTGQDQKARVPGQT